MRWTNAPANCSGDATLTSVFTTLCGAMRDALAAFAHGGEEGRAPPYPRFNASDPVRRQWGLGGAVVSGVVKGYRASYCDFWDEVGWVF